MRTKAAIIAFIITTLSITFCYLFLYFSNQEHSLVQDTFKAITKQKIVYELEGNDELRTRYGNIRLTDIGTQHEIDSIRPIRSKNVIEIYRLYKELNK
jgi:hypothetical protein